jgi:hypothetical protein
MPYEESEIVIPSDLLSCSSVYKRLKLVEKSNFANMIHLSFSNKDKHTPNAKWKGNQ